MYYQLLGENVEMLFKVSDEFDLEQLKMFKKAYQNWENQEDIDEFEDFWNEGSSEIKIERIFVEEIYV